MSKRLDSEKDQIPIRELVVGQEIVGYYALRKKEMRDHKGSPFVRFEFGDASGRISAVVWDNTDYLFSLVNQHDVAKVKATVTTYRDALSLQIHKIRRAESHEFSPTDFLPSSESNPQELFDGLCAAGGMLKEKPLRDLLHALTVQKKEKWLVAPGGKLWHHVYLGGLMEHALGVLELCNMAASRYRSIDTDMLLAGALLHDVGKLRSYSLTTVIELSDEGRLIGHLSLGESMVREAARSIEGLSQPLLDRLCHIILSHQQRGDHKSTVQPQTIEAIVVSEANRLDATVNAADRIISKAHAQIRMATGPPTTGLWKECCGWGKQRKVTVTRQETLEARGTMMSGVLELEYIIALCLTYRRNLQKSTGIKSTFVRKHRTSF